VSAIRWSRPSSIDSCRTSPNSSPASFPAQRDPARGPVLPKAGYVRHRTDVLLQSMDHRRSGTSTIDRRCSLHENYKRSLRAHIKPGRARHPAVADSRRWHFSGIGARARRRHRDRATRSADRGHPHHAPRLHVGTWILELAAQSTGLGRRSLDTRAQGIRLGTRPLESGQQSPRVRTGSLATPHRARAITSSKAPIGFVDAPQVPDACEESPSRRRSARVGRLICRSDATTQAFRHRCNRSLARAWRSCRATVAVFLYTASGSPRAR
jgi:hypothetical protein